MFLLIQSNPSAWPGEVFEGANIHARNMGSKHTRNIAVNLFASMFEAILLRTSPNIVWKHVGIIGVNVPSSEHGCPAGSEWMLSLPSLVEWDRNWVLLL